MCIFLRGVTWFSLNSFEQHTRPFKPGLSLAWVYQPASCPLYLPLLQCIPRGPPEQEAPFTPPGSVRCAASTLVPPSTGLRPLHSWVAQQQNCLPVDSKTRALGCFPGTWQVAGAHKDVPRKQWFCHIYCVPATLGTSFILLRTEAAASQRGALAH